MDVQIYHAESKVKPFILQSMIDSWLTAGPESVSLADAKENETGLLSSFICEVSEEVCSQLHFGIMKAARRVVLDEIISHIIAECVASRKAERHLKIEAVSQAVRTCSLDGRMV